MWDPAYEAPWMGSASTRSKRGAGMVTGTVKWFNATKGFGFITPDEGGKDAFVHISEVERSGLGRLAEGQRVNFNIKQEPRGLKAVDLAAAD